VRDLHVDIGNTDIAVVGDEAVVSYTRTDDFIDAADRVVVRWAWHGAGQGPETSMETTAVFTRNKSSAEGQDG
jgi:hypothetical protein